MVPQPSGRAAGSRPAAGTVGRVAGGTSEAAGGR
ncbi:MAG: hypothetical protein QOJ68_3328, partial [Blastococcus sp.]|nr:hypothetical protein [Blastococcus sp.]